MPLLHRHCYCYTIELLALNVLPPMPNTHTHTLRHHSQNIHTKSINISHADREKMINDDVDGSNNELKSSSSSSSMPPPLPPLPFSAFFTSALFLCVCVCIHCHCHWYWIWKRCNQHQGQNTISFISANAKRTINFSSSFPS